MTTNAEDSGFIWIKLLPKAQIYKKDSLKK